MYNNQFIKRYKSIPIAKYSQSREGTPFAHLMTATELHKEFEMIYVHDGSANITINHTSFIVGKGDLLFISPYSLHSVETIPNEAFSHTCFCFDLNMVPDTKLRESLVDGVLYITNIVKNDSCHSEKLVSMFKAIDDAMTASHPYWELVVQGNLSLIFSYIMQNSLITDSALHSDSRDFCIKVSKYIKNHYKEKVTSSAIAEEFNFHQGYFCRIFKKNFAMCFSDYLNMYRLEKAKLLLIKSDISITDVAYEAGYDNPSYFTKIFRVQNGVSPRKFREVNSIINKQS